MDPTSSQPPPADPDLWTRFLIMIAAVQAHILGRCSPEDWSKARATGGMLVIQFLFQAGVYSLMSHTLFSPPGQVRIELILASLFLAGFVALVDRESFVRPGWYREGRQALIKRGGLAIPTDMGEQGAFAFGLLIRLTLAIGQAQLSAIIISLLVFGADVGGKLQDAYLRANSPLIERVTALVDTDIQRATDAVKMQTARVETSAGQVASLRQAEIDPTSSDPAVQEAQQNFGRLVAQKDKADEEVKAAETVVANEMAGVKGPGSSGTPGRGLRYRAAMDQLASARTRAVNAGREVTAARDRLDALRKALPAASDAVRQRVHDQLPLFVEALETETAKLAPLKQELVALTAGREEAIRRAVEAATDHVARTDGLLGRIAALEKIAQENTRIAVIIILFDIVALGFELAVVVTKFAGFVPTTYTALLYRDTYMRTVRIAEEMMAELNAIETREPPHPDDPTPAPPFNGSGLGLAPEQDPSGEPAADTLQPAKRKRGRPRKHPLMLNGSSKLPPDSD